MLPMRITPVPHIVVDEWAPASLVTGAIQTWPDRSWPSWHQYEDDNSVKLATMGAVGFPGAARILLDDMSRIDVSEWIPDAFPDLTFYGGGMHWMPDGGFLKPHLDAEIHPLTGWSRVLNAILFLESGGGELVLHGEAPVVIDPKPGRLVMFETQGCRHGVNATKVDRRSLAVYWWACRSEVAGGRRAVFDE